MIKQEDREAFANLAFPEDSPEYKTIINAEWDSNQGVRAFAFHRIKAEEFLRPVLNSYINIAKEEVKENEMLQDKITLLQEEIDILYGAYV